MSDRRIRELERRAAASGAAEDLRALDAELRRSDQDAEYYAGLLLRDLEDELKDRPLVPGSRIEAGVLVPDHFGRIPGLSLAAEVGEGKRQWSTWTLGVRKLRGGADLEGEPSPWLKVTVALIQPLGDPDDPHPFYFHRYNAMSRPIRSASESILFREFTPERFLEVAEKAYRRLHDQLVLPGRDLADLERAGVHDVESAFAYAAEQSNNHSGFSRALMALQSVGPVERNGVVFPNPSGDGLVYGALEGLMAHLTRCCRAIDAGHPFRAGAHNPYESDSGYFAGGRLHVTSRRARRTRHPQIIEVDFDRMGGALAGKDWIGNEIPPDGRWSIIIGGPATVQDLYEPTVDWIREHFPNAHMRIAPEDRAYGEPGFRDLGPTGYY